MTAPSRFASQIQRFRQRRFLVVDDFAEFRHSMKKMLEEFGAGQIDTAASADEAIELFRQKPYDVVLADFNLGEGKDGQQLLEELHAGGLLRPDTTYMMLTAENAATLVMGALENRPDDYLTKPFAKPTLLTRLDRAIERKESLAPLVKALLQCPLDRVTELCERFAEQQPRLASGVFRLASEHLMRNGHADAADNLLARINEQQPIAWALCGQAWCALQRQDAAAALTLCDEALAVSANTVDALDLKAEALRQLGDGAAAFATLQEAGRLSPRSVDRQRRLAQLARQQGDWAVAYRAAKRTLDLTQNGTLGDPEDLALAADAAFALASAGDGRQQRRINDELSQLLQQAGRRQSGSPATEWALQAVRLRQLVQRQRLDDAGKLWQELKRWLPLFVGAQMVQVVHHLATALEPLDSTTAASLKTWLEKQPQTSNGSDNALVDNRIGLYAYQQGDPEMACQAFTAAQRQRPDSSTIALNVLQTLLKLSQSRPLNNREQLACRMAIQTAGRLPAHDNRRPRFLQLQQAAAKLLNDEDHA